MVRIFLCHASEDKAQVREIYQRLAGIEGFKPWLDEEELLPGELWEEEIPRAIETSDFILIFFSHTSVAKRGYVQREMKMALDAWEVIPSSMIHTIPVRLDECEIPERFRRYHYANLFDPRGFNRLVTALHHGLKQRGNQVLDLLETPPVNFDSSSIPSISIVNNSSVFKKIIENSVKLIRNRRILISILIMSVTIISGLYIWHNEVFLWYKESYVSEDMKKKHNTEIQVQKLHKNMRSDDKTIDLLKTETDRRHHQPQSSQKAINLPPTVSKGAIIPNQSVLYLLVASIDRYRDSNLRLTYAVADGKSFASTIQSMSKPLFRTFTSIELFDERVTFSGFDSAFRTIASMIKPEDVFILYLSGQGVSIDGKYYFLPQDLRYINNESIPSYAISQNHLQDWMLGLSTSKILILIDTCESGAFSKSMPVMHGIVDSLSNAVGVAAIAATTAKQSAIEGYKGHGLFTYVLLEGLYNADNLSGNRDGYTGVFELASYVNDHVAAISMKEFGFKQLPQVYMIGSDFPIAVSNTMSKDRSYQVK